MISNWKLSQDGNSASRTLDSGAAESRLITAIPADELVQALPADVPTHEQMFSAIEGAIELKIQEVAVQGGWLNHDRCMLRASYPNPWQAEALAYSTWVDNCWLYTLTEKAKIVAGTRTNIPTPTEAVLELPAMVWPV